MMEFTYLEDSRNRYNEMLREAEAERRAMRFWKAQQHKEGNSFLVYIGNWLIHSGSWLKQRAQMDPA
ncbi:MAG: hypothetical protein U0175_03865 [Caldilineaceae bacterium]